VQKNWLCKTHFAAYLILFCSVHSVALTKKEALPFFRKPNSLFISGYKNIEDLNKTKVGYQLTNILLVEKNAFQKTWIPRDLFILSEDLNNQTSFGQVILPVANSLKTHPDNKSTTLLNLPNGTKLNILKWKQNWVQVEFQNILGWIDSNSTITKYDFVESFYFENEWHQFKRRDGDLIISQNDFALNLNQISDFRFNRQLAIAHKNDETFKIYMRNHFTILERKNESWNLSQINGHGAVYWQEMNAIPSIENKALLSTEELMKKEISFLAFQPALDDKSQALGVASSRGIWLTLDTKTWHKLTQFKDKDYPLAVNESSHILVGPYLSTDKGQNFYPLIRWEELARKIEAETGRSPKLLKLKAVQFLASQNKKSTPIELTLDLGAQEIKMSFFANDFNSKNWKFTFSNRLRENKAASSHAPSLRAQRDLQPGIR
jgi:hypothetical protein